MCCFPELIKVLFNLLLFFFRRQQGPDVDGLQELPHRGLIVVEGTKSFLEKDRYANKEMI